MDFLCDPAFSRFGTTPACDRRTDSRTHQDSCVAWDINLN